MRLLCTFQGHSKAESFTAYLLTQNIDTNVDKVEGAEDAWEIWIRDEDFVTAAKTEYDRYLQDPTNPKYTEAIRKAADIRREQQIKQKEAARNIRTPRTMATPVSQIRRIPPLTLTLTILCVIVGFLTNFEINDPRDRMANGISEELQFVERADFAKDPNPATSILKGEVWRLITPIFLHGSLMHLLFNMIMLVQLGRLVEATEGTGRFALIVLFIAIFSNLLQGMTPPSPFGLDFLGGSPFFVGISGVVFGIFGLLWIKSTLRPDLGFAMNPTSVVIMLVWLAIGFAWRDSNFKMANLCHLGGLLSGMFLGWLLANWNTAKRIRN